MTSANSIGGDAAGDEAAIESRGATTTVDEVRATLPGSKRLVVLDDDPTGSQTIRDIPVLTTWEVDDLRWALGTGAPGFYVVTNSRSLPPAAAAAVNRSVAEAALAAAETGGVAVSFASRGDSTLRGHFPLEPDTLADVLAEHGHPVAAVLLAPAYVDAGRITVDGVHYTVGSDGARLPVGASEYALDATFGYRSSRLSEWVEEKSQGRVSASDVGGVTLEALADVDRDAVFDELTAGGPDARRVVVIDAVSDADLRRAALGVLAAERAGVDVIQRVGPSYVRARLGQQDAAALADDELAAIVGESRSDDRDDRDDSGPGTAHGLVVVGSHVPGTTRQLQHLERLGGVTVLELDARTALDPESLRAHADDLVERAAAIRHAPLVLRTSRELVRGDDESSSLAIATTVSAALVGTAARIIERYDPAYVIGKGGITSSDVATDALGMRRAWVRGPMLRGIVSLWTPADDGRGAGRRTPYVVFPGNVGDETALAEVVGRMEKARSANVQREEGRA